jgi:vacuolar-type H+-ATPase subunit F/Vma7
MSTPTNALASTQVGPDLIDAGSSFGALLLGVGNAVAATQQKLTETSAETTSVLAQTLVDVIAVQETIYDDLGTIIGSNSFTQKLPLINFVDPVFYQYPQVRLQARFAVSEFATSSTSDSSSSSGQFGLQFSANPFAFGLRGSGSSTSQSTRLSTQAEQNSAIGQVRMFAQIAPRTDVGVPKPTQVIVGPSLSIVEKEITDTVATDGTPIRTMAVLIQLRDKTGQPIGGKAISIETDGTPWSFTPATASTTGTSGTDAGNVSILLTRSFPAPATDAPPLDLSPKQVALSVRLGLVSNGVTVTF